MLLLYDLFTATAVSGQRIAMISLLESISNINEYLFLALRIHVSADTKGLLEELGKFLLVKRGVVELKVRKMSTHGPF